MSGPNLPRFGGNGNCHEGVAVVGTGRTGHPTTPSFRRKLDHEVLHTVRKFGRIVTEASLRLVGDNSMRLNFRSHSNDVALKVRTLRRL